MRNPFVRSLAILLFASGALWASARSAAGEDVRTFRCQGFDEPLNRSPLQIGRGRVLPLRAKLILPDGSFGDENTIKTAPMVTLKYQPESGPEVDKTSKIEVRDFGKGNHFVWDDEAHWEFDLGTLSLPDDGKYVVTLVTGDEKEYRVDPTCRV